MGTFTRPIALFRKGEASVGPFAVADVAGLFGDQQAKRFLDLFEQLKRTGEPFTFEGIDRSGKTPRYFAFDAEAEIDELGRVCRIFGVTRDVTAERSAQIAIAEQQELLEKSQVVGQIGHWRMPLHGQTQVWSGSLFRICRMEPVEIVSSETFRNMIVEQQRQEIFDLVEQAVIKRSDFHYVCDVVLQDGEERTIETVGEPQFDEGGRCTGYFGISRDVTELQRASRELRRQTRLLERAQRIGRLGHWEIDADSNGLTWSASLYEMFGVSPEEEISVRRFFGMLSPEDRVRVATIRDKALANLERFGYVADITCADGRRIVIETSGEPDFDGSGRFRGYFGTTQDITERVAAEKAIRDNEVRLQTIFDAMDRAGIGIGVQNNDGLIEVARPALLRIAGLASEKDVLGKRWSDIQGEGGSDIRGRFGEFIRRAAAGEMDSVPNLELEWARPDGHRLSVLVRLAPLPGGARAMIVLDQTEQKVARREIEAREFRTRAILDAIDSAGIGYCVEDTDGRIFDVSPALRKMLGISESEDLLGRKWTETLPLPHDVIQEIQRENETYLAGSGEAFVYPEFVLSMPDRGEMQLHARSTPLPGIGRLVLVIDQTERWRLEEQQAEMERHMQHVQKMEAVGQLAGGVAHEINNMLHPIRTFTRAASRSDDEDQRRQLLARVIDCADKAAKIVRETLHFARGDDSAATDHDLNALLSGVVGFSRDLPMRGVELEFALPAETLRAAVNETEFTQVIVNLLQNAADAMGDAGTILVELSPLEVGAGGSGALKPGRYAQISVEDTGDGMSPEVIDRVFEPFFTTKEPGKGTGLGLSVVYGIVKRWKGDIRIASEAGRGTRVSVILPRITHIELADEGAS